MVQLHKIVERFYLEIKKEETSSNGIVFVDEISGWKMHKHVFVWMFCMNEYTYIHTHTHHTYICDLREIAFYFIFCRRILHAFMSAEIMCQIGKVRAIILVVNSPHETSNTWVLYNYICLTLKVGNLPLYRLNCVHDSATGLPGRLLLWLHVSMSCQNRAENKEFPNSEAAHPHI